MGLIDSHAHLTDEHILPRLSEVLSAATAAGLSGIITIAQNLPDSDRCVDLAKAHAGIWATAGVHPHEAGKVSELDLGRLGPLLRDPLVVACGEMGLDYHYDFSKPEEQRRVFRRQLELAADTELPLVVHCREALDDTIALLTECGYRGRPVVFHCFNEGPEQAGRIRANGWRLSFTGVVTYKSAEATREVARFVPADELMIETDSPYLAPKPLKKRFPNEPAHLVHIARLLADLRGEPFDDLVARTAANTRAFFGLDDASLEIH